MTEQDLKAIPELVFDAVCPSRHPNTDIYSSNFGGVAPLVIYDHDWEVHILVQEWDNFAYEQKWVFSLWFVNGDGATKVRDFPDHKWEEANIPYVASALIVEEWRSQ